MIPPGSRPALGGIVLFNAPTGRRFRFVRESRRPAPRHGFFAAPNGSP
jgi:hypothetical protein